MGSVEAHVSQGSEKEKEGSDVLFWALLVVSIVGIVGGGVGVFFSCKKLKQKDKTKEKGPSKKKRTKSLLKDTIATTDETVKSSQLPVSESPKKTPQPMSDSIKKTNNKI